jgi:hypothetical protein
MRSPVDAFIKLFPKRATAKPRADRRLSWYHRCCRIQRPPLPVRLRG